MARRMVDLPLPFAPTMATMCPGESSKLTPCTAGTRPYWINTSRTWSTVAFPQIRGDDGRVTRHRRRRALGDLPPVVEDQDPVREGHDALHHVLDDDASDPPRPDAPDQVDGFLHFRWGQPGHHLVEEEELGPGGERAGHLQALLLGHGEP